jgi:stage II sporulation protein AA (anti-sigma F factor antagonist)
MRLADLRIELVDRIVVARLDGELDMSNAAELGSVISDRVTNDALGLVLDLTKVDYIDSAGIRALFEIRGRLRNRGQEIRLVVAPGAVVAEALRIVDLARAIGILESDAAALESIAAAAPHREERGH